MLRLDRDVTSVLAAENAAEHAYLRRYFDDVIERALSVMRAQDAQVRWLERVLDAGQAELRARREEEYRTNLQAGNTVIWLAEWGRRPRS